MPTTTSVRTQLHHEVRGSGPPVLFISGASGDAGHFARAGDLLADEFTVVTFDRRGCSRSGAAPAGPMRLADQADDAAALIEELGLAPAIVVGSSGGGSITLELLARRPGVLRGAIVHEPPLIAVRADRGLGPIAPLLELSERDPRSAMEAFWRLHTSDETFERLDPEHRERVVGNGANFFGRELMTFGTYLPDLERIRAAGVPLRILVSDGARAGEVESATWLAGGLDLPLGTITGHHAPYVQHPDLFAAELRPLLRELV